MEGAFEVAVHPEVALLYRPNNIRWEPFGRERTTGQEKTWNALAFEQQRDENEKTDRERSTRGRRCKGGQRERTSGNRRRRGRENEERRKEKRRASCSHYLTYYTGSMPSRPSRGPTSLHLASLGSPLALLSLSLSLSLAHGFSFAISRSFPSATISSLSVTLVRRSS